MRHERSAGGVLVVPLGQALLVALTVIRDGRVLALPKGRIERGEEPHEAALREVREETGLTGALVAPLPESAYRFHSREWGARVSKRVAFYLMAYRAGSPRHHDGEVEAVRLVPLERAERLLTYPGERRVMAAACARLGAGWDAARAGHPPAGKNPPAGP